MRYIIPCLVILWMGLSFGCREKPTDSERARQNPREDVVKRVTYEETKYLSDLLYLFPAGCEIRYMGVSWSVDEFHMGFKSEMEKNNPEKFPFGGICFVQDENAFHYWFVWDPQKGDWKFLLGVFYDKHILF